MVVVVVVLSVEGVCARRGEGGSGVRTGAWREEVGDENGARTERLQRVQQRERKIRRIEELPAQ